MTTGLRIRQNVPLRPYVTLRVGGPADHLIECRTADELASAAQFTMRLENQLTVLGSGSNVLPSDRGVRGNVILNLAKGIQIFPDGKVVVETGCAFQDLFLKTAQAGFAGFEYAVGIPGTVGGALVSNAGAYRSNISEFITKLYVVTEKRALWVDPSWMQFSYRDSILRSGSGVRAVVTQVQFQLMPGNRREIYDEAREYQRQRISKQPPSASAGSFFKNVNDKVLALAITGLPAKLKESGVVPAGYLIESVGMKGHRHGGAMLGARHANFMLNVRNATATEIRELADLAKQRVKDTWGVALEEEVLSIGDWA